MKNFLLLLILLSINTLAGDKVEKRSPQALQDRIRSEFGLDRFEITCEFIVSGDKIKPRHSIFYEEIKKSECLKKAKKELRLSPKIYFQVLVKHKAIEEDLVIKRRK